MRRFADWPERLAVYLDERTRTPFAWGFHDCCAFACDGVLAQCGIDPMRPARGRYRTPRGAMGWIGRNGGSLEAVAEKLGAKVELPRVPVLMAGRGCVVLGMVRVDEGEPPVPALGLVGLDSRVALFAARAGGYEPYPLRGCLMAWGY